MSSTRERAWLAAHQKGSKALVQRLDKAHANNPEYQAFKKKHGLGDTSSVKQVSKSTVDRAKEKARQTLAGKAYGATKGTRMGSAEGTGETLRDTIAPLTRDQHSAVKAAEREAKAAEKPAKPAAAPKKPAKPKKEKVAAPAPEKKKPSALELIAAAAAKRKINQPPVSAKALRRIAAVGDMEHEHGGFEDLGDTEYGAHRSRSIDEGMLDDYIEGKIEAHHKAKSKEDLAKSDAAREALSKKITPLNKKIASIKGSVTYKNKEHPRHSVAAEKLKTVRAERAAISAEREKHYNAFAKTRTARDEKIASDTKTYRNFGLVGLGLKKLKQKMKKEEVEQVNEMDSEGYKGYRDDDVTKATHKATPITRKAMAKAALKALKGTPVVSLADVSEPSDYKKDKYGRTVPKKLAADDPRVKYHKEEVEQIDEMKYRIGTVVKLKKPIDGHGYATVKGFTSSGSTRGPTGRGVPMPAGDVKKVKVALRKSDDHSYYAGPITHIEHGDVHSVIRESAPGWMLKQDPKLAKKVEAKKKLAKKRQKQMGNPTPVQEAKKKHYHGGALFADTAARLQKAINAHKERMDQITNGPEHEYHHPTLDIKTKSRLKLPSPWVKVEDK